MTARQRHCKGHHFILPNGKIDYRKIKCVKCDYPLDKFERAEAQRLRRMGFDKGQQDKNYRRIFGDVEL